MRALVTGASGFVGRHMVTELRWRGWEVLGCDTANPVAPRDVLNLFRRSQYRYDLVVHAAARSPHRAAIDGDPGMHAYNAMLDAAMFDWAIRTGQRRVLYLSSCAALDGPVDDYAAGKLHGERLAGNARAAGVPVTVVRPFSGYGEDQGEDWPFGAFVARARRHEDPFTVWGDGRQVRDWVHIDDMVAAALAVVESGTDEPVSLCTGIGTSMRDLAAMMIDAAGYSPMLDLRADMPAGTSRRVGDPTAMRLYHVPRVSIEEGVRRALDRVGV